MQNLPIAQFIEKYANCQDEFLYGWCYAFASMLEKIYHGTIYYLPIQNHQR